MYIELRTPDELIRALMLLDDYRHTRTLRADQTELLAGTANYTISPHVIPNLIGDGWLTPVGKGDGYQFDIEREDEWLADETARIEKARRVLLDRYPTTVFLETCRWNIFHHPCSANMDSRGFVFTDKAGYEYLVCEACRIEHPLRREVAL